LKKPLFTLALTILVASLTVFLACNKNAGSSGSSNTNPNNIPPDQTVTANLQGRVVDQNGVPVQGAAVTSGVASTTTDVNGVFSFSSISLSSRFGFVQVVKSGFFTGSRSIITNPGASNYVNIQLIPMTATGTFPAPTGGKIAVQTGDTAAFAASSVVEAATGAAYTGTVHVFATYLDPTDSNLYKYMPGDLRGIGSDGNETALQSFGMIDVEMQDDAGNKLQLASGQQAMLTWAIPASLQAAAPATIPLWYFNDTTGKWIQQGTATRLGNNYVGQVGHFTFWNCDAPIGTVNFSIYVKDQHGNPLPYVYIEFTSPTLGTRGGYTNLLGFAQGMIPKGQELLMQVVTDCGGLMGGVNVGPALTDQNLGTVTVTVLSPSLVVTGTVVNCSSSPVDSGYVTVLVDGLNYAAAVTNGAFILPLPRCYSTTAQVRAVATDYATSQVGTEVTVSASSPTSDSVNVGQLSACNGGGSTPPPPPPSSPSITCLINGNTFSWVSPAATVEQNVLVPVSAGTEFQAINTTTEQSISVITSPAVTATGSYSAFLDLSIPGTNYQPGSVQVTISSYGAVNGFITGTYTGMLYDTVALQNYPVTGTINVTRLE